MTGLAVAATVTAVLVVAARVARQRLGTAVPAALLGGAVALVLRQLGWLPGSVEAWQDVGYHLFGASFLAIGLTPATSSSRALRGGAAWMGVGQWVTFPLQAVVGGLLTWVAIRSGAELHPAFGFLAPMGLNEGPGQAVSIGRLWESEGLQDAPSIGATMASLGFVVAYVGGLVVARLSGRLRRGRGGPVDTDTAAAAGSRRAVPAAVAVAAGYLAVLGVVSAATGAIGPGVRDAALAVLFFVCLLVGLAVRRVLAWRGVVVDAPAMRAVTVGAVDGLTVAILGSLTWAAVSSVAVPMVVVVAATVAATAVAIAGMGRRLASLRLERQLALFGTVTGTAASGLALVAMVDPDLETSATTELGAAVVVSTPVVLGGIAVTSLVAAGTLGLGAGIGVLAGVLVVAAGVQWLVLRRIARDRRPAPA